MVESDREDRYVKVSEVCVGMRSGGHFVGVGAEVEGTEDLLEGAGGADEAEPPGEVGEFLAEVFGEHGPW